MTDLKPFLLSTLTIGLFSLFSCGDPSEHDKSRVTELDTISFEDLSKKAYEYLYEQQEICDTVYKIGSYEHWFYDQMTGELTFSHNGEKKLIIDYEEVGSVSEATNTFLWAWANANIEEKVRSEIIKVEKYGGSRGFDKLTDGKWKADLYDGWEMTAIASYLLKAKGAYRVPSNNGRLFSFMIFKSIRWADTTSASR
jgi:hypothetical protein